MLFDFHFERKVCPRTIAGACNTPKTLVLPCRYRLPVTRHPRFRRLVVLSVVGSRSKRHDYHTGGFRGRFPQRNSVYRVLEPQKNRCLRVLSSSLFLGVLQRQDLDSSGWQLGQQCPIDCHASGHSATTSRKCERTFYERDSHRSVVDSLNGRIRKCAAQFFFLSSRLCQAPR